MSEWTIIANPTAGGGSARAKIPRLAELMRQAGLPAQVLVTERRGHAIELARQAALQGDAVVVAAGGDGTVNEVINGLVQAAQQGHRSALGVLCIGRGNDFAAGVGIPETLSEGVQVLLENRRRVIDLGQVKGGLFPEGRYFGNCVGVGFDAMTTIQVANLPRLGGFLSFLIAVLKTIFLFYKGPTVKLDYDEQSLTFPTLLVSVMNGRRLGGGFWLAPVAEVDDGWFDLCLANQVSRREILRMIPHFMKGTQGSQPAIRTARARRIAIQALHGGLPAQTDGEILCVDGDRLEIELLPQALEVIVGPHGPAQAPGK